jgi:hypothetical protein
VQALPHARALPLVQSAPAGDPGAEAELLGQVRPGDPGVQDEEDPLQRLTVGQPPSARVAEAPLLPRKKRLDELPQLVGDDPRCDGHRHPSQLDDGCRRPSSSESGSLHSEISSNSRSRGRPIQVRPLPRVDTHRQAWGLGHGDGDGLRYAGPEHRHSRDCPEGGYRATTRHCKAREMYLEQGRLRARKRRGLGVEPIWLNHAGRPCRTCS